MLSVNFQDKVNKRRESLAIAENRHELEEALAKVKSRKDPFECSAIIVVFIKCLKINWSEWKREFMYSVPTNISTEKFILKEKTNI